MTSFRIVVIPLWIAISFLSSCNESAQQETDILTIEGVSWACNVTTSYAVFGSATESEEHLEITLPASDGDLLYMLHEDFQIYHRYSREDGNNYIISIDTSLAVSAYLNGRLSYLELTSAPAVEAFKKLEDAEMEQLAVMYLADVLNEELIVFLQEHESSLQGIGLILENNYGPGRLQDLLSILRPRFLVIDESWILPDPEENISLSSLELLWVEGNIEALEKLARCCSNLESLIIADWEPEEGELLPLGELKNLKSLTIAESSIISLASLECPKSLQDLYLIACDTLSDINSLRDLRGLKSLGLTQCTRIDDPGIILELESLEQLSFPPEINQQEFQELTQSLNELQLVELVDCPDIQDLYPLQALPELRILQLQLEHRQLKGLEVLDQLELLVLNIDVFDDKPEWINELRTSLQDVKIVPGSGICLGSGWLLLLLPFILFFRFLFRCYA
jgi:hypothetical protein